MNIYTSICLIVLVLASGCAKKLTIGSVKYPSLIKAQYIHIQDMSDREGLRQACVRSLEVLDGLIRKGSSDPAKLSYYREQADTASTILSAIDRDDFEKFVNENYELYKAESPILFTGYYTPLLHGSRQMSERYQYPVFGVPDDLVLVDLKRFGRDGKIKGMVKERQLVPYFMRKDIDNRTMNKHQPLLYVDDKVDLFFMQIQGSGIVSMDDGSRMRLNYAESNGHSYISIGALLIHDDEIPKDMMSMQAIKEYFRNHPDKVDAYLNQNPSYVFFKEGGEGPYGSTGAKVTPFRTIAADQAFFPKFGLAYIKTDIPKSVTETGRVSAEPFSGLFFDHDSGGAIKGNKRIDIYFGEGEAAAFLAGYMKYTGSIYYLKKRQK